MFINMLKRKFGKIDIRDNFAKTNKILTMLYSSGSVEVQQGLYVTQRDINARIEKLKKYRFC